MKLWQLILNKLGLWDFGDKEPVKPNLLEGWYNPLNVRPQGLVDIDGVNYSVVAITEHTISNTNKMTDYLISNEDRNIMLRLITNSDNNQFRTLILYKYDSFGFNQDFIGLLNDGTNTLNLDDDEQNIHDQFWRRNDVTIPLHSQSRTLRGDQLTECSIEFWDYSRMTDINNSEVEEYVYVEKNEVNGWITIYRGTEAVTEVINAY